MMQLILSLAAIIAVVRCASPSPDYLAHQASLEGVSRINVLEPIEDVNVVDPNFRLFDIAAENATTEARYPFVVPSSAPVPLQGYTRILELNIEGKSWTIWEDLTKINGNLVYASATGEQRVFHKNGELWNPPADPKYPRYAGRSIREVGMALEDLLATEMLKNGEPVEEQVKSTIPALVRGTIWSSIVGNVQAGDVVAIYQSGGTKSFQVGHAMPGYTAGGARERAQRYDGYLGGWMPAVRKVWASSPTEWHETTVFGDVDDKDPFIVQTWHRTVRVSNGKVTKVAFGKSYPTFAKVQSGPKPELWYTALFRFGEYWNKYLADKVEMNLPDPTWTDMTTYAFAKELLIRPGGVHPKYGAFERDYGGSEYSGFQDIFTSSLSSNLEWGRFEQAKAVLDNYYTLHTTDDGDINMRGPEVGQFGLSLSLIAKYAQYTGDIATLEKHKKRIIATAGVLIRLHDESLALPQTAPGYGILHGWSESDAALKGNPALYWKPYYGNSALAARGLIDIARLPVFAEQAPQWNRRAEQIKDRLAKSARESIFPGTTPPYVPPMAGVTATFRQDMKKNPGNSEQDWPHRLYAEMLHGNVLPADLANAVVDTIRAYGSTSMGVVANVAPEPSAGTRDILGFISYGHALSLLYLDRIDEFVLFMYTHRYHVHSRGAWNAGEVTGTAGGQSAYCQPSQATIPILVRWALVIEDQDAERLYLGRGVPRGWIATGKEISIKAAPTRWGKVDYAIQMTPGKVTARIRFVGKIPGEFEVKMRVPKGMTVKGVTVNGKPAQLEKNEGVLVKADAGATEYVVEASV